MREPDHVISYPPPSLVPALPAAFPGSLPFTVPQTVGVGGLVPNPFSQSTATCVTSSAATYPGVTMMTSQPNVHFSAYVSPLQTARLPRHVSGLAPPEIPPVTAQTTGRFANHFVPDPPLGDGLARCSKFQTLHHKV